MTLAFVLHTYYHMNKLRKRNCEFVIIVVARLVTIAVVKFQYTFIFCESFC